ncbi:putative quinol monooxygenase [Ilumatobacter sp.]|uniref:putative quinol monooxygenase n=1 Tax=Ilumatobacter sp. TaxID=1967498 RepID=UPI003C34C609
MAKSSLIAKLTCAEGKNSEFEAALEALIEASNEEAGLEVYSAHRDADNVYWFFEIYADDDAVAAHGTGDGMRKAMAASGGFLAGPPEIHRLTPVVAKGLAI